MLFLYSYWCGPGFKSQSDGIIWVVIINMHANFLDKRFDDVLNNP